MEIKATVLCENFVMSNLGAIAEHGWAVFLETDHGNYLFDTGQGKGLVNNARVFHTDLSSVQGIIISHHHADHTGGLLDAVTATGPVPVYAHPDIFKGESYSFRQGKRTPIGIPFARELLECKGAQFRFNRGWVEIAPRMFLTGEIPRETPYETVEEALQTRNKKGQFIPDPVIDDQALIIDTEDGLLIILGCAHSGVINTINHIIEKTGETHVNALIGGTHLWPASEEQREKSIDALKGFDIDRIGVSHCTGQLPAIRLSQEFKHKFFFCNVGSAVEV